MRCCGQAAVLRCQDVDLLREGGWGGGAGSLSDACLNITDLLV